MAQHAHATTITARRPARPIDLVHLARQCLGDASLEQEILRLFDTTIKTYRARLQSAPDIAAIALNLHALKGAAAGVGARTIADLAKAAEVELAETGSLHAEHISDLSVAIEETSRFIAEMLDGEVF